MGERISLRSEDAERSERSERAVLFSRSARSSREGELRGLMRQGEVEGWKTNRSRVRKGLMYWRSILMNLDGVEQIDKLRGRCRGVQVSCSERLGLGVLSKLLLNRHLLGNRAWRRRERKEKQKETENENENEEAKAKEKRKEREREEEKEKEIEKGTFHGNLEVVEERDGATSKEEDGDGDDDDRRGEDRLLCRGGNVEGEGKGNRSTQT